MFKRAIGIICAAAIGVVAFGFFYSQRLANAQTVTLNKSFYFLVSTDSRVEASAEFAKLDGGAGYLLEEEGSQYVALAVYLSRADALSVQEGLGEALPTCVVHKGAFSLSFVGKEKRKSALYLNALRTLEGYICILNECIARLEKGSTQESCKRLLTILQRQFAFAEGEYEEYPEYAKACGAWSRELEGICKETVYLQRLRYLLCWQVEKYLQLCEAFH